MKKEMESEQAVEIRESFASIYNEISKKVVGQEELVRQLFCCLLCEGHALIEGVPGLGKTLLVKSFSEALDLRYSRIQFTPDLMPADIIGTNMVREDETGGRRFEFFKGPIFGQVVLADEINRATPKTQSALLEAMQEKRVTVFGENHILQEPFMVLATQNPIEMEGTYPLPEAQVDRFLFKLIIRYPDHRQLLEILDKSTEAPSNLKPVVSGDLILGFRNMIRQVPVASYLKEYAIRLVEGTHPQGSSSPGMTAEYVRYGASPRGLQTLVMSARAMALLQGRFNVSYEDIRECAIPSLRHRIILNLKGEAEGINTDDIIKNIIGSTPENG